MAEPSTATTDLPVEAGPSREEVLEPLFTRISEISSLPTSAVRLMQLVEDERADATDLLMAIETDPAMASRVLRRINSSHYGLRERVSELRTAISLLGFREIRNLSLTIYVARLFRDRGDYRSYSRTDLWRHLQGVAAASRLISQVCRCAIPEEAYLAGLLHDIGFILLDEHLRRHFCRVVDLLDNSVSTPDIERYVYHFDHAELGAAVAAKWNFPPQVIDAIRYHHEPQAYAGPHRETVYVVAVANYLASRFGWTSLGVSNLQQLDDGVYAGLELRAEKLAEIWNRLPDVLKNSVHNS